MTDADNTLWDTNGVYVAAQMQLLDRVHGLVSPDIVLSDRLGWLRSVDQEIAQSHPHGLRYPPALLVATVAAKLSGRHVARPGRSDVDGILSTSLVESVVDEYLAGLRLIPALGKGVTDGLSELKEAGARVLVVTEGARTRITDTLFAHSLSKFVDQVVEAKKSVPLFARLRATLPDANAWSVGDQLDKDVLPAIEAGLRGIYIEGGFRPVWHPAVVSDAPYQVASSYQHAVATVLAGRE